METSQPLATESFSYSWLTNKGPDFYSLDDQETMSMVFESKRFLGEAHNFYFDIPCNKSSIPPLVDADEIFSAGQIMPSYSLPAVAVSFREEASSFPPDGKKVSCLLLKWRKSAKRLLQKCFGIIRPRKSIRVAADIDRKGVGDQDELLQRISNSSDHVPRPPDSDSSISEAVLHCKRSISMLS